MPQPLQEPGYVPYSIFLPPKPGSHKIMTILSLQGSFTLTSGSLAEDPIALGASASAVNGALDSFGRAAALELENGVRIN